LCHWCIDRRDRSSRNTPERILWLIQRRVEPLYLTADVSDFSGTVQNHLTDWDGSENLYFVGDTGTGKTRAMYALLKIALANHMDCKLVDFGKLCRTIRASFDTKRPEQEVRDEFLKLDVLFIDDMGLKNSVSDYEYDVFYDILDSRISNQLSTVISSNKTPGQVAAGFDKRIGSRLQLFREIEFSGEDRRRA